MLLFGRFYHVSILETSASVSSPPNYEYPAHGNDEHSPRGNDEYLAHGNDELSGSGAYEAFNTSFLLVPMPAESRGKGHSFSNVSVSAAQLLH
jgi:hypothetical protein